MSARAQRGRKILAAAVGLSCAFAAACEEVTPTAVGDVLPGQPVTVEVAIPWSEFASNLEVFGGYGSPGDLGEGVLANAYEGVLDARTLLRFQAYPTTVTVRDSTGTQRPDSNLEFIGGRLVTFFDTIASTNTGPVTLAVGSTQTAWDARTANWAFAVDSINDQRAWGEPGGGPVSALGTVVWDPAAGDSAVFALDSATVAAWSEIDDPAVGTHVALLDPGSRLRMSGAVLRLDVRPSINPDTTVVVTSFAGDVTFLYSIDPTAPGGEVRIGGAPAWRTILDIAIPEVLNGPPEFCAVVSCPHTIDPVQISYASLVLTSRTTEAAFQPTDSIRLDVRPVFDRPAMPKAPLGNSLIAAIGGRTAPAEAFGAAAGFEVQLPFTTFARDLLRGEDEAGNPVPGTLALLSVIEPFSIGFASFDGPGTPGEPVLRLVLTIGPPVELP